MSAHPDGLCHQDFHCPLKTKLEEDNSTPSSLVSCLQCSSPPAPAPRHLLESHSTSQALTAWCDRKAGCVSSPNHTSPAPGSSHPLRRGAWPPPMQTTSLSGKFLQNSGTGWWSQAGWGWLAHFRLRLLFIWAFWGGPVWGSLLWPHVSRPQEPKPGWVCLDEVHSPPPAQLKNNPVVIYPRCDSPSSNAGGTTFHGASDRDRSTHLGDPDSCTHINLGYTAGEMQTIMTFHEPLSLPSRSLREHHQPCLSACSVSGSRGGRCHSGTDLRITVSSLKPRIVFKTDVLAPSHLLQPRTRLSDLLEEGEKRKRCLWPERGSEE